MRKRYDHGYLHLERVLKVKPVLCGSPFPMQYAHLLTDNNFHAKELIVYDATINAHKGHEVEQGTQLKRQTHP